jgi:ribokinase
MTELSNDPAASQEVVILGSMNMDSSHLVDELPSPGETVFSREVSVGLGGKGANQAVAAARAGARVILLGAVGDDGAGVEMLDSLVRAGVDISLVQTIAGKRSGRATLVVDKHGQNVIVVSQGANGEISRNFVTRYTEVIARARVLTVQCEIPVEAISAAVRVASDSGVRVVLNLAPHVALERDVERSADPLVLNEIEAAQMLGIEVVDVGSALRVSQALLGLCKSAVITLGSDGAVVATDDSVIRIPAPEVAEVVDTSGAGDAFVGVLSAALALGASVADAAVGAVKAATRSVQVSGTSQSYPDFRWALPGQMEVTR